MGKRGIGKGKWGREGDVRGGAVREIGEVSGGAVREGKR